MKKGWQKKVFVIGFFVFISVIAIPIESASAALQKKYRDLYSSNSILFYNPDEVEAGGEGEGMSGTCSCMDGIDNIEKIVHHYAGRISANGIAGMLGNFEAESGLSPFRNQGQFSSRTGNMSASNGYGIAQFTPRTKILPALQNDPRTAAYYNQYYDQYYGGSIGLNGGIPEGVPNEVDAAWLCVQLEYIDSAELSSTRVGTYRNDDGGMGLSYISDNMSILEALNAAQTPEDAARIYLWIYERPKDKRGTVGNRETMARAHFSRVEEILSQQCSSDDESDGDGDGSVLVDGYVFPIQGAKKSNVLNGKNEYATALSPLPCGSGFCHHTPNTTAVDTGIYYANHKTENDYPDLVGKWSEMYWYSVGAKVLAPTNGKITSYKPYNRATLGYENRCASVTFQADDGITYWLGHMSYDSSRQAGDTFSVGQVIGEVGPPPCAISTQGHLHIDVQPTGTPGAIPLMDKLYEALPN